jgi:ketosteroid isomerase-like protein
MAYRGSTTACSGARAPAESHTFHLLRRVAQANLEKPAVSARLSSGGLKMRYLASIVIGALVLTSMPAVAETASPAVTQEIIGLVKAEWAALAQKNVTTSQKNMSEDYTELNSEAATRVDGRSLAGRLAEAGTKDPGTRIADEMLNPKVQVYGDTAILSYNFLGLEQDKDGKVKPVRAKSSRVYVKQGGQWMLVHANFGADPLPQ